MAVICPNENSQEWRDLLSKTGSRYENYRLFIANDNEIPTERAFSTESDVVNHLKQLKSLQLYNGYVYIKANKPGTTYIQDTEAELNKINKLYPGLVELETVPINPFTERFVDSGRTVVKRVKVNDGVIREYGIVSSIMEEVEEETSYEEFANLYREANITVKGGEVLPLDDTNNISFYQRIAETQNEKNLTSEKTIRDLAERMADRIGLKVRYESDRTKDYKGKLEGNTAVINLAYATLDTPIHEILGHPIIRALKTKGATDTNVEYKTTSAGTRVRYKNKEGLWVNSSYYKNKEDAESFVKTLNKGLNNQLYQNLLKELETGRGKEVLDRIKRDYQYKETSEPNYITEEEADSVIEQGQSVIKNGVKYFYEIDTPEGKRLYRSVKNKQVKYTLEEQQEEAIVELLGLYTADRLDKVKDGKLISLLKRLLKEMKAYMKSLFNAKEVKIDELPDNMTLGDIADLLAYRDSKLILPGNEVIYTTPDNQTFKTYQEASNHISELANYKEISLIGRKKGNKIIKSYTFKEGVPEMGMEYPDTYNINYEDGSKETLTDFDIYRIFDINPDNVSKPKQVKDLKEFISKNKEYEQSKEIIEEWKKVNDIKYDPEEVYSRGQGFYSVVGAYSDFDIELMFQNLLAHIEDNKKAGGEFTISAFTKPVNKQIGHLEGGGGKIKFRIHPKSKDIKWAANTDVFSGSVWDASKKVSKDTKSEIVGVSYTKSPALNNIDSVQPNLAAVIDNLAHHHNELGIELTGNNFRLEYDDNVPYSTKKLIDKINGILDSKFGKLVEPKVKNPEVDKYVVKTSEYFEGEVIEETHEFNTSKEAESFIESRKVYNAEHHLKIERYIGKQPTQTNENLKESIESIKKDKVNDRYIYQLREYESASKGILPENYSGSSNFDGKIDRKVSIFTLNVGNTTNEIGMWQDDSIYSDIKDFIIGEEQNKHGVKFWVLSDKIKQEVLGSFKKPVPEKEYTSQAEINTKIAALKKGQRKFPRSLIRSEVVSTVESSMRNSLFDTDDLVFQLLPKTKEQLEKESREQIKAEARRNRLERLAILKDKAVKALERKEQRLRKLGRPGLADDLKDTIKKLKEMHEFQALLDFVLAANKEINSIFNEYLALEKKQQTSSKNLFTLPLLQRWFNSTLAYDILDDISSILNESAVREYISKQTASNESLQKVLDTIDSTINQKNTLKRQYAAKGLPQLAKFLANYSTRIEGEERIRLEREYNNLPKEEKASITKQEYIDEKIGPLVEDIKERTELMLQTELHKASRDINYASRWIANLMDSPDPVVSAMVKAFFFQDQKARREILDVRDRIVTVQRELEEKYGTPNEIQKLYDFMLEKDENGNPTQHLLTQYKSSLFESYKEFYESTRELEDNERRRQRRLWMSENAPLDHEGFNRAKYEYYNQLVKEGKLTEEEVEDLIIVDQDYIQQFTQFNQKEPTREETSNIVNDEAAQLIDDWVFRNIWDYRRPIQKWLNPDFAKLEKFMEANPNDPKTKFYNLIKDIREEADSRVPWQYRLQTRLPGILKASGERLAAGQGVLRVAKEKARESFKILSDETDRGSLELTNEAGRVVNYVPIYFTNRISLQDQSFDLGSIYYEYYRSATDFAYKSEILPELELTRFLLETREVQKTKANGKPVYDPAYKDQQVIRTKAGSESQIYQQFEDWTMTWVYGKSERDEGTATLFGVTIDKAKAADWLNRFTSINMLAGNFTQGTANVILGETMQRIETFAGRYINRKAYRKGRFFYDKNFPGIIGDIGSRKPKNIVSLLLERFDVLNEYDRADFRKDSRFGQLMKSDTLFFTSKVGEHFIQSRFLLGMLANKKAYDADGNELGTMLDMYKAKDGKLILDDRVDVNKSKWTEKDQDAFLYKTRGVLSQLHGEYSRIGKVAIERRALGRMAFMFRKFVEPGFRRRWGNLNYNERLEDFTEGNYRTTGKFFKTLINDMRKFQFDLLKEDWNKLTDVEKANIHRTIAEVGFLISAIILSKVFLSLRADQDDDRDWIYEFAAYQMLRYRTELLFFFNPAESLKILRSPAASMAMLENTIKVFNQLMTNPFEVYERGHFKGDLKLKKQAIDFIPIRKQIYKLRDIQSQLNWWVN
jgi:hypothetical protein